MLLSEYILRKPVVLTVWLLVGLWSCQGADSIAPIPTDELTDIITEALILEPAGREIPIGIQDSVAEIYYDRILAERGYSLDEFTKAMAWLQEDSERLVDVYNEVMEKLTVIESEQQ